MGKHKDWFAEHVRRTLAANDALDKKCAQDNAAAEQCKHYRDGLRAGQCKGTECPAGAYCHMQW
jgi:hypothetical protein